MIISEKQVPKIELPAGQVFHRVQRTAARKGSVKINRMILPPAGIQAGRFCQFARETSAFMPGR